VRVGLFPGVEGSDGADDADFVVGRDGFVLDGVLGLQRSLVGHGYHSVPLLPGNDHGVVFAADSLVGTHAFIPIALEKTERLKFKV